MIARNCAKNTKEKSLSLYQLLFIKKDDLFQTIGSIHIHSTILDLPRSNIPNLTFMK